MGARITRWWCVGLAVLFDAVSCVQYLSGEDFSGRGDFSLGVNMGSDSIPRGLVYAHMNSIAHTQKILMFMS